MRQVDSELLPLPATAQVAAQQGKYLGHTLNALPHGKSTEPFHYRHMGSFAYIGGRESGASGFHSLFHLTLSIYSSRSSRRMAVWRVHGLVCLEKHLLEQADLSPVPVEQYYQARLTLFFTTKILSRSNKTMVAFDWSKELVFGRDVSRV
jgi:NADH:ubiquinone reductase (non-electrogenic)